MDTIRCMYRAITVYYVRAALKERTGKDFSVEDVEKALVAEGFLEYERG